MSGGKEVAPAYISAEFAYHHCRVLLSHFGMFSASRRYMCPQSPSSLSPLSDLGPSHDRVCVLDISSVPTGLKIPTSLVLCASFVIEQSEAYLSEGLSTP